jgi:hypothetical protein
MEEFKLGDLIVVRPGAHERGMPHDRMGLIIRKGLFRESYVIQFTNGFISQWHVMFLKKITNKPKEI